ncbi:MAG: ABC transporter substrate-binding protein, partial [Proteobacteria bacterium]|nr:ABC transporter substrate-binding protein [Pseudomonadota bacterium]
MTALKNINKSRIPLLAVIVSGLVVFSLMATGVMVTESQAADRELRIGVLTSLKMECGQATINAVKMAIAKVNAQGGVLGRKLKLFVADSESSPEKGITGLKRLVEKDKVHVLLGGASSGVVLACMDYLKRYNKVFMSIGVS